jgi:rhodanese-related sulfurtransferase
MQFGTVHPGTFDGSPAVEPDLLAQELRSGRNLVIVDVRNKDEFSAGHIEGARWIPIHQLVARACEITSDKSISVITVSSSGNRAGIAAAALRLGGYEEVATLLGGMRLWVEHGHPVARTSMAEGLHGNHAS